MYAIRSYYEGVIDVLEAVEVEQHQADAIAALACIANRTLQFPLEGPAIRKRRKKVLLAGDSQTFLRRFEVSYNFV